MLASCRIERKIYSSLPVNNPSLQDKGDYSVSATISDPKGFDLNGGFAVTNRLALIAGAYTHKNKDIEESFVIGSQEDSSNLIYRHKGFTLGAGIFFPIFKKKPDSYLSFYSGINTGSFRMNEAYFEINPTPSVQRLNEYKSKLNRYFLQGSINYYGKSIEASATTRFNLVEYKNVRTDYTNTQLSEYQLPPFVSHRLNSFVDFSTDLKVFFSNRPRWGIQFFTLISTRTNEDDDPGFGNFYHYYPFRIGTGIFFRGFSGKGTGK